MMSRIRKIIELYFNNIYSDGIRNDFINWFTNSHCGTEKDEALHDVWEHLDIRADESTQRSYSELESRINKSVQSQKRIIPLWQKAARIAAMLLIPLFSVAVSYYLINKNSEPAEPLLLVECFVPNGQTKTIVLPDSSRVELNAGSILIYPQKFIGKTRNLYLNGEASFNVTKNADKPFVVNTADMEITVLGTVFNVAAYADSENSSATLAEGSVSVELKNEQKTTPIILKPNEQIMYDRLSGRIETKQVNVENVFAWHEGSVILQGQTIYEVIKTIERRYGVEVYLSSTKFDQQKVTAKFVNNESLDGFLSVLKMLIPQMQYRIEKQKVYIY